MRTRIQGLEEENSRKNEEISQLKSQKVGFLEEKSDFSSINSLGLLINSTKNSEEMNKMRKWLNELKSENQSLREENSLLRIENKRTCELIIQEKSQKIIRNIDTKLKNNENLEKNEKNAKKANNSLISSENSENKEKTKKFRFIKPKTWFFAKNAFFMN